jgi:hypothetical protein
LCSWLSPILIRFKPGIKAHFIIFKLIPLILSSPPFNINSSISLCSESERRGEKSESEDSKSFSEESSVSDNDDDDEDETKEDEVNGSEGARNLNSFMDSRYELIIPKSSDIGLFADDKGFGIVLTRFQGSF